MQMYRVKFAIKMPESNVDIGDVVVCAQSNDLARDMVMVVMSLPRSGVEMEVHRVKPSIFQISRRIISDRIPTYDAHEVNASVMSRATFPGVTESRRDWFTYDVQATATIKAENENEAISKLAIGITREMSGEKQKRSITDLDVKCDRKDAHPRSPAVEENGIFSTIRIFQGGDTRT